VALYFFSTDDVENSSEVQKLLLDKDVAWIIDVNKDSTCSFATRHLPAASRVCCYHAFEYPWNKSEYVEKAVSQRALCSHGQIMGVDRRHRKQVSVVRKLGDSHAIGTNLASWKMLSRANMYKP
jgi:hypothetical protein